MKIIVCFFSSCKGFLAETAEFVGKQKEAVHAPCPFKQQWTEDSMQIKRVTSADQLQRRSG